MKNKFEEFLQDAFLKQYPETLDDAFPDAFNNWLNDIGGSGVMSYYIVFKQLEDDAYEMDEEFAQRSLQELNH